MREIKFRTWDKSNNKWVHEPSMFYMQNHEPFASTLHVHEGIGCDLMQYTGLKDKNGVEIYEGDIITHEVNDMIGVVNWNEGLYRFVIDNLDRSEIIADLCDYDWQPKVIGNIYENPELLEAELSQTLKESKEK